MANDPEVKRLDDWKVASKKYCDLLEDMVKKLRDHEDAVPSSSILTALANNTRVIQRAGQSFRDDVDRAVRSAPPQAPPPSPYGF